MANGVDEGGIMLEINDLNASIKCFIYVQLNAVQILALVAIHLKNEFYLSSFWARKSSASLTC